MRPQAMLIHPTIVDLKQAGLFPADLYKAALGDVDELMAEYKVPAPPKPPNLTAKQSAAWDMLGLVDITARRLAATYMLLLRQFTIAGTTMCDALKQFNATSWKLYDVQRDALGALRAEGYQVPPLPPYPIVFTNLAACAVYASPQTPANPAGVGVDAQNPRCPADGLGFIWIPIVIGVAVVSYFGYKALDAISSNMRDIFVAREVTEQAALEAEYQMYRAARAAAMIEQCQKAGGDPVQCVKQVYDGLPVDLQALRAMKGAFERPTERGMFWWLGLAGVLAGVGAAGYGVYRWRKKGRKRESKRAEAPKKD